MRRVAIVDIVKLVSDAAMTMLHKLCGNALVEAPDTETRCVDIERAETSPTTTPPVVAIQSIVSIPPAKRHCMAAGANGSLCKLVKEAYRRLVMRRIFYPRGDHTSQHIQNPFVDGYNVVESTCVLVANGLGAVSNDQMTHCIKDRIMICACLCIVCKNAVDHEGFPGLRNGQFRRTPLAVVYHTLFEVLIQHFSRVELDVEWLQQNVESAEGAILTGNGIFRVLNDTPTMRFEIDALERLLAGSKEDTVRTLSILRNIVSFYVYMMLVCADVQLNELVTARPTDALIDALASIAIRTIAVCEDAGGPVIWSPPSLNSWCQPSAISARILDAALARAMCEESDAMSYPFDAATMKRVRCENH